MADYWKSNDRKYCDFCKCWTADNKPSIQFHENGRRHKLNVQKRITDISRKSYKDQKVQSKINEDMKKMNDGAMKSYMMDISAGADMSSRAINDQLKSSSSDKVYTPKVDPMMPPGDLSDDEFPLSNKVKAANAAKKKKEEEVSEADPTSMWCEAKTEDGNTYYWNVKTNESVWEPPKEGYMKLAEYEKLNKMAAQKQEDAKQKEYRYGIDNADEIAAKLKREQIKERTDYKQQIIKTEAAAEAAAIEAAAPPMRSMPYGTWEVVVKREVKQIDYELPEQNAPLYVPSIQPEVIDRKFKEKVITTIAADEKSSLNDKFFKKRKVAGRNARQRLDVD